jgi:hypothetical protein
MLRQVGSFAVAVRDVGMKKEDGKREGKLY